jgi:hypothetical protein
MQKKPLSERLLKPVTMFFNASHNDAADRHRELLMALQNPTLVHGYDLQISSLSATKLNFIRFLKCELCCSSFDF